MPLDMIAQDVFLELDVAALAPIYWPNIAESQAPTVDHLRAFIIPADTESRGLASWDVERGVIQVSVYSRQGVGVIDAYAMAEAVLGVFPRGTSLAGVKISVSGSIGPGFMDGAWFVVPVSIPYYQVR